MGPMTASPEVEFQISAAIDDPVLSRLHHRAFGSDSTSAIPWASRLANHSLLWVTARDESGLIGFVNVISDGGVHAVILDTVVDPERQGEGVGRGLVEVAASAVRQAGCHWLHVDFEASRSGFYLGACGFRPTSAGLRRLT